MEKALRLVNNGSAEQVHTIKEWMENATDAGLDFFRLCNSYITAIEGLYSALIFLLYPHMNSYCLRLF